MTGVIAVLVPTFRRPQSLTKTLDSLLRQDGAPFPIVVAENDLPDAQGEAAARAWAARNHVEPRMTIIRVPERGFSQCRNAGLAAAFGPKDVVAVAMVDDDATASPAWLSAIAAALERYRPEVLGGPTLYRFGFTVPPWIEHASMFGVPHAKSGIVRSLRSANNCTLARGAYESLGPAVFDTAYGRSGGEDMEMFARASAVGMRLAWTIDAEVVEPVPPERATEAWVLQRHYVSAANAARADLKLRGRLPGAVRQASLIAKEALGGALRLASGDAETRFVGRMRLRGIRGRLAGISGHDIHYS